MSDDIIIGLVKDRLAELIVRMAACSTVSENHSPSRSHG